MSEFKKVECTCSHGYTCRNMQGPNCYAHSCDYNDLVDALNVIKLQRDALAAQMLDLSKLHSDLTNAAMVLDDGEHSGYLITSEQLEDMEHYLCEPILCLAAHDAEVAAKAVLDYNLQLRKDIDDKLPMRCIGVHGDDYAAQLRAKAGA